jgi:predicted Holliday junction resolvase-like endonuclease
MSISQEFVISLFIQLIILAFFIGIYVATIKFMQQQIKDLKESLIADKRELKDEMHKYNNVLSRIAVNENSVSAAHHRIDSLEERFK